MGNEHRSLDAYVRDIRGRYEDLLGQAVEIPSISMDPANAPISGAWRTLRGSTS